MANRSIHRRLPVPLRFFALRAAFTGAICFLFLTSGFFVAAGLAGAVTVPGQDNLTQRPVFVAAAGAGTTTSEGSLALYSGANQGNFALVSANMLRITTGNLPRGRVGQLYSATLTTSGGTSPYTWTVSGLPAGLTLTSSTGTGKIGGYPSKSGTFSVNVMVKDSGGETVVNTLSLTIGNVVLNPLAVNSSGSATGTVGVPLTITFTAANAVGSCTWTSGTLPPRLLLQNPNIDSANDLTETLTGTPTLPGTYPISITVHDAMNRNASANFELTINDAAPAKSGANTGTDTESAISTAPGNWSVGSSGGTLTTSDNLVSIVVPSGAFSKQVTVSIAQLPVPYPLIAGFSAASPQWSIQAIGAQPNKALTVTLPYDPSVLGDLDPARLGLYYYNPVSSSWTWVGGTADTGGNTITADTFSMGAYTILLNHRVFQDTGSVPWAQTAINTLLGANVIGGTAPGQFDPDGDVTRAQFVTMLTKVSRLTPVSAGTTPFADVSSTSWYAPYVAAAYNDGLITATGALFQPEAPVTREQMAVWVANLLGNSAPADDASQFIDFSSIDSWAVNGVNSVLGSSIMGGFPDGTFRPLALATRAEAAVVLYNYLQFNGMQ